LALNFLAEAFKSNGSSSLSALDENMELIRDLVVFEVVNFDEEVEDLKLLTTGDSQPGI